MYVLIYSLKQDTFMNENNNIVKNQKKELLF